MPHESDTSHTRRANVYASGGHGDEREEIPDATPMRPRRRRRRSPLLAIVVLVAVAVVIALAGVAARGSGLEGSQETPSTFKLLPITTTTS
jgi:ferric-dicitrate binding protein FerR (iron transport regulator)